ncbi:MAG: hypothetical protein ACI4SG_06085 [Oligosphaeraceae bacterium]
MKQKHTLLLLFCAFSFFLTAAEPLKMTPEAERGMAELSEAFARSTQAEYISILSNEDLSIRSVKKVVFYRQPSPEAGKPPRIRADFLRKDDSLAYSLLQNEEGTFAIIGGRRAFRGGFFSPLYVLEALHNPLYSMTLKYSEYKISSASFQGRRCRKYLLRIPQEAEKNPGHLPALTGLLRNDKEILASAPFAHEILVDEETGWILLLRQYRHDGKIMEKIYLENMVLSPDWTQYPDIFRSPAKTEGTLENMEQFLSWFAWERQQTPRNKAVARKSRRPFSFRRHLPLGLGVLAFFFLGGAYLLKRRHH